MHHLNSAMTKHTQKSNNIKAIALHLLYRENVEQLL